MRIAKQKKTMRCIYNNVGMCNQSIKKTTGT